MTQKENPGATGAAHRAHDGADEHLQYGPSDSSVNGDLAEITVFTKNRGPLVKRISLAEDGSLISNGSACLMTKGDAERVKVRDVEHLAEIIAGLTSRQAIALGRMVDGPDKQRLVTKNKLNGSGDAIARDTGHFIYYHFVPAFALFDIDTKGMPPEIAERISSLGGFWEALVGALPALSGAAHIIRPSTSSNLSRKDTKEKVPGSDGQHIYVRVHDGADIVRFLTALHERCWLAGFGWIALSRDGKQLERSLIDRAVGSPERLVFEGPPILKSPLVQGDRSPTVVAGGTFDTITLCPPLSAEERRKFDQLTAAAKQASKPLADERRAAYIAEQAQELVSRAGMDLAAARTVIENQCNGTLLPDVVLAFVDKDLEGCTVGDVLDDPDRFKDRALADPIEGVEYGRTTAKVLISKGGRPWINSFAHGGTRYTLMREEKAGDIVSVRLADVEAKPIEWLWHHRIARGKITILSGDPGVSKSLLSLDIAAHLTKGAKWPDSKGKAPLGSVIILSAEDDVADTIRVRFAAAGGDATKCHVLQAVKDKDGERTFDLTRDIPKLQRMIEDIGDVVAIVADPVNAYMGHPGKLDSFRDTDLRSVLTPLAKVAADKHVAVIAIVHLTKDGRRSALMSVLGSVGMVAAARSVFLVIEDATDPKRILFLRTKSNIAPKGDATGMAYKLHERPTGLDIVPYAPGIEWEADGVAMTADDAIAANRASKDKRRNPDIDKAEMIITEMIQQNEGSCPAKWIQERLKAEGISQSTWRKAKEKCGAEAYQPKVPGPWYWRIAL